MAQTPFPISVQRALAMQAHAALLLCVGVAGWTGAAAAEDAAGAALSIAEVERAFWACDHAATVGRIDTGTAITCGGLTEMLKVRKFGGDFNAMLAWWRLHKEAEHLALDKASGGNALARLPEPSR